MKDGKKNKAMSMATGISLGMMLGAAVAAIAKWDIALGISIGMLFGIAFGEIAPERKDKSSDEDVKRELESK